MIYRKTQVYFRNTFPHKRLVVWQYNSETGIVYRGIQPVAQSDRITVYYDFKSRPLTHAIWDIVYGYYPRNLVIDHIDNCPMNNKLSNLQEITARANVLKGKLDKVCGCYLCLVRPSRRLRKI